MIVISALVSIGMFGLYVLHFGLNYFTFLKYPMMIR